MPGISGSGLALATAGGVVLWAGLAGVSPIEIVKTVSSGKAPPAPDLSSLASGLLSGSLFKTLASADSSSAGGASSAAFALSGSGLGAQIAADALRYVGTPYVYAGNDPTGWDCSGFVNYVLGHDLGIKLPNSRPTSQTYYAWSGLETVPTAQAQAGDLACWLTHVAICTSATECVGAENPRIGTVTGTTANMGPGGETYVIRRLKQAASPASGSGGTVAA